MASTSNSSPKLTYRQTSPNIYRVSADGVEIGAILEQTRHVHPFSTYWHWGVEVMPLMSQAVDRPAERRGASNALRDFKLAFARWLAGVPPDVW